MNNFTIYTNEYLRKNIKAYYHTKYTGYKNQDNPDFLNDLKNTFNSYSEKKLLNAIEKLNNILINDLSTFSRDLTICIVPRAKAENNYKTNQLLFKKSIQNIISNLGFIDGSNGIIRHTDTKTTHLSRSGYGGNGSMPYPNITKDTCHISNDLIGKDILLIDDIYTSDVNIDEDVIQALIDKGANSVIFYSIGKAS